jgi:hypothetical protein
MALASEIHAQIKLRQTSAPDLGQAAADLSAGLAVKLASGFAAGQADRAWTDERTLAASASENLDLAGVLADVFGAGLTFAKVKALLVAADADNVADIVIGGAASNAFVGPFGDASDTVAVKPGGAVLFADAKTGWTVTAGTGDQLKVLNGSGAAAASYKIVVLGTSA